MTDFIYGFTHVFLDPVAVMVFIAGMVGGLLFGAIPGLSAVTLATVLLPFTGYLSASNAIMLLAVIYVSGIYGGAVTAILFNIPGSAENAPTAFDGYPMTQKGQSGRAIGAAVICSALGGIGSCILMMTATAPLANWAIRAFGPPELFSLIFLGLSVAASVGADTVWKGWLSVLFGLLLSTVGTDPISGFPRFDFGISYLAAGINFVPLILGFFAVSEVFVQGHRIAVGLRIPPKVGIEFPKFAEFWRLRIAVVRSMLIGFFAGILPGIGAVLASFLSYGEAVRWSKHPERFGKGELEGVVASETANNAATGAAMIPLLALGLPGGALTAVMVGAFQIHGMEPGPLVLITSKDLVWIVFVAMFFANVGIFALGYLETKTVVHLLRVPFGLLAPMILIIATIGAYALRNLVLDVWVMFVAGIVGYLMRRSGYSMAGIVLGVILGELGESAFVKSMQLLDYNPLALFTRPVSALLVTAGIASLVYSLWRGLRHARVEPGSAHVP
jgi:putative tricarboxylic transport membrane protein